MVGYYCIACSPLRCIGKQEVLPINDKGLNNTSLCPVIGYLQPAVFIIGQINPRLLQIGECSSSADFGAETLESAHANIASKTGFTFSNAIHFVPLGKGLQSHLPNRTASGSMQGLALRREAFWSALRLVQTVVHTE